MRILHHTQILEWPVMTSFFRQLDTWRNPQIDIRQYCYTDLGKFEWTPKSDDGELFSQKIWSFWVSWELHVQLLLRHAKQSTATTQSLNCLIFKKISVGYVENIAVGLQTRNPIIWEKRGNFLKNSCKLTNSTFCSTSAEQDRKNPHKAVSSCARRALPEMVGMATTVGKQNPKHNTSRFFRSWAGLTTDCSDRSPWTDCHSPLT